VTDVAGLRPTCHAMHANSSEFCHVSSSVRGFATRGMIMSHVRKAAGRQLSSHIWEDLLMRLVFTKSA